MCSVEVSGMAVLRRLVIGVALLIALAACGPAPVQEVQPASVSQSLSTAAGEVVWARVPYCNCLAGAATANVANALKEAKLAVTLKEVSPHEGWLYFVASFDPESATLDQVGEAIAAGGGEVTDGPP